MSQPIETIRRKVLANYRALESLSSEERKAHPSTSFAQNYNNCQALVAQAVSSSAGLLPPAVRIYRDEEGRETCEASFAEFFAYYSELASIVNKATERSGDDGPDVRFGHRR